MVLLDDNLNSLKIIRYLARVVNNDEFAGMSSLHYTPYEYTGRNTGRYVEMVSSVCSVVGCGFRFLKLSVLIFETFSHD